MKASVLEGLDEDFFLGVGIVSSTSRDEMSPPNLEEPVSMKSELGPGDCDFARTALPETGINVNQILDQANALELIKLRVFVGVLNRLILFDFLV